MTAQQQWILALSILAGIGTVVGQTMVRKRMWQGWVVSLCNQVLFVYLNYLTGLYGYFIFSAFFTWNACWGIYEWRIKPPSQHGPPIQDLQSAGLDQFASEAIRMPEADVGSR
jgi:nicotinamide riboside transporter PnuC